MERHPEWRRWTSGWRQRGHPGDVDYEIAHSVGRSLILHHVCLEYHLPRCSRRRVNWNSGLIVAVAAHVSLSVAVVL